MTEGGNRRVLLIEDSRSLIRAYEHYLADEPFELTTAETGGEAVQELEQRRYDAVLLDLRLPDMDGMEILKRLQQRGDKTPVVVITAHGSINIAVEAMRLGAYDFLVKPFNKERLVLTLRNATDLGRRVETGELQEAADDGNEFHGFVGGSGAMQQVYKTLKMAAASKATVFVVGESGTGKELAAHAVHALSPRAAGPMVAINCAAIPKGLIESEIFGHVRGAFTGAVQDREGAASRAHNGTLFLDEICEMDLDLQSKLLRFVQTGSFEKVGDSRTRHVDVRFVCATNQDPMEAVREGRFREDLFYRLHVIPLSLPPLRERGDDIMLIAERFLQQFAEEERKDFCRFSADAAAAMTAYHWPGNIRELQNIVRSITVLYDGDEVTAEMMPPAIKAGRPASGPGAAHDIAAPAPAAAPRTEADIRPLEDVEREAIEQAVEFCQGNIARAASLLGVSPSTIYRKKQVWEAREEG
ncbi:sigma-54-dependent transcriptional regulator [Minwuia thermotolerans]|uniref:Sigma-54-dependent Fis family transcriptional regulator n=1 Tax=Minwuia thermotolerans TaxID=2056226 RepID=A0A2M9FVY3_9PROT|nr:sigma-54 dependent transcriptional regulator [Minwuia thermotolerans]PJK27611.1 sigma-54-dependent Fis family transcriptional regulator [Minwuia thermotolerans]